MRWRRRRRLKKVRPGDGSELTKYRLWQSFSRSVFYIDLPPEETDKQLEGSGKGNVLDTYAVDVHFFAEDLRSAETIDKLSGIGSSVEDFIFGLDKDPDKNASAGEDPTDSNHHEDASSGSTTPNEAANSRSHGPGDGKMQVPPAALYRNGIQIARANVPATFAVPGGVIDVETSMYGLSRIHYVNDDGAEQILQPDRHAPEGLRARFDSRYPRTSKMIGWVAVAILIVGLVTGLPQIVELFTNMDVISTWIGWSFESPINLPSWVNTTLFVAGILAATERALTLRNHWFLDMDSTWWSL